MPPSSPQPAAAKLLRGDVTRLLASQDAAASDLDDQIRQLHLQASAKAAGCNSLSLSSSFSSSSLQRRMARLHFIEDSIAREREEQARRAAPAAAEAAADDVLAAALAAACMQVVASAAKLAPLRREEGEEAEALLRGGRLGERLVVDAHQIPVTHAVMSCLSDGTWLNDEVINFYMSMIVERANKNRENK
jgi:hypothetical protein